MDIAIKQPVSFFFSVSQEFLPNVYLEEGEEKARVDETGIRKKEEKSVWLPDLKKKERSELFQDPNGTETSNIYVPCHLLTVKVWKL